MDCTKTPPLSIIGFTHSKRSPLGIRMPQDLSVCFSMEKYGKEHLKDLKGMAKKKLVYKFFGPFPIFQLFFAGCCSSTVSITKYGTKHH